MCLFYFLLQGDKDKAIRNKIILDILINLLMCKMLKKASSRLFKINKNLIRERLIHPLFDYLYIPVLSFSVFFMREK